LDWFRDKRTSKREHEAREDMRKAQLFERRANFQRETLLALQDAAVKLARAAGRMHHFDAMEYKKTGKWGGQLLPAGLSSDAMQSSITIMILKVRVRDEVIRELVNNFRSHANRVGVTRSEQASQEALSKMAAVIEPLHDRIGDVLRKLDDDEDAQYLGAKSY
jgi:uncharacterized membrane protein